MASFEDYDEFGNYIGGDLESDDDEIPQDTFASSAAQQEQLHAPLEGFDEQPEGADSMALMEVDGQSYVSLDPCVK